MSLSFLKWVTGLTTRRYIYILSTNKGFHWDDNTNKLINMTSGIATREVVEHQEGVLTLFSDGTFERCTDLHVPPSHEIARGSVVTRDVEINPDTRVWARLFRAEAIKPLLPPPFGLRKVPIVLHFHGGGFCVGSPAAAHTDAFCRTMSFHTKCLWVSVGYRLAPEHKLPAAYEDGMSAFRWLSVTDDPWISELGDVGRVFVAGESAGATMVHYVAGGIAQEDQKVGKVSAITGLLLVHPAFPQEKPAYDSASTNLSDARVHFYHTSALPEGAKFGHPLMNPLHPETSVTMRDVPNVPVLVAAADGDPLLPGAIKYFEALRHFRDGTSESSGLHVCSDEFIESKGVGHCFHLFPEDAAEAAATLRGALVAFISRHS